MQYNDHWWPQAFGSDATAGCGGVYKREPEDFEVEEIPAYLPCGEGEHLYLWVQKRKLSTPALLDHVARIAKMKARDIGCAGMKDTFAVTRQMISVPAAVLSDPTAINNDQITVLRHGRHGNKLKTGHLRGNRFTVVLRPADVSGGETNRGVASGAGGNAVVASGAATGANRGADSAATTAGSWAIPAPGAGVEAASHREANAEALRQARAIGAQVEARGVPNFFGEQRLGRAGETVTMGLQALRGDTVPAFRGGGGGRMRRLALSAVQSALFNQYLNGRVRDGLWQTVLDGDVMQVCASGGPFVTDDVPREQARFEAREVVPAGPIFGPKMRAARGAALAREQALLTESGCDVTAFGQQGKLMLGTRRPLVVWPEALQVESHPHGLALAFTLPAGAYATVVLREFCRC